MKKICLLLVLIVVLSCFCAMFVACNDKNDGEIILWWPSGRAYVNMLNDALQRFQLQYPEAKIKVQYKDIDAFDAYKMALNDDKTRPDVAIIDHVYVQALAHDDQLLNLTSHGTADFDKNFPENLYQANAYAGNVYALPFSANTIVLMVNKDILRACGIVDEKGEAKFPTTFDELLADCETVQNKGYIAFAQPLNSFSAMAFASYVSRCGGSMVSADGKTVTFDNDGVLKALDCWKKLSAFANANSYEEDKFYSGKVAFVEMGSWSLPKITGSSKLFDSGFAEMVSIDSEIANYSGLGVYSLCVSLKTRNKQLSVALAEFLASDKTIQLSFNKEKKLFPVTNEALSDSYYTENEAFKVFANQLQKVTPRPATPVWPDMEQAIINMLLEIKDAEDLSVVVTKYQNGVQSAIDRLEK